MTPLLGISLVFLVVMAFALLFVRPYEPSDSRGNPPGTGTLQTQFRRWRRNGRRKRPLTRALALACVLASCSGTQAAQHPWPVRVDAALTLAAHAVDAADAIAAQRYTEQSQLHGVDLDALDRRYEPLATVRRLARERIVAAEQAVAAGDCTLLTAARLVAIEMQHLGEALALGGVTNAAPVTEAVAALGDVIGTAPLCPGVP